MDEQYTPSEAQEIAQQRSMQTPDRYYFVLAEAGVGSIVSATSRYPYAIRCANAIAAYHAGAAYSL